MFTGYLTSNTTLTTLFRSSSGIKSNLIFAAAVTVFLGACSEPSGPQQTVQVVQAVKLAEVSDYSQETKRSFPAEVSAVKTIDLSFEVSGRLQTTNLPTGTLVKKGDLLAQLDPTPFEQVVSEAEALLAQASRKLSRIEKTYQLELASQSEMDAAKTEHELAEIALQRAKQDLSYTRLVAPFDAQVSERLVENNSYVSIGDTIAHLQDISRFYFNVNVPERLLSAYKEGSLVTAKAFIISSPEKQFELQYIEHDTQSDPITQTYKVVFATATNLNGALGNLTPGARAVVEVSIKEQSEGHSKIIPFTALVGSSNEGFKVWHYNEQEQVVRSVPVNVQQIDGAFALIQSELVEGERVVAAGASKMREGLVVKPYHSER